MTHKDLHESNLTISGSIILGACIIAWAIVWSAGSRPAGSGAQLANGQVQQQGPQGAAGQAPSAKGDITKLKTAGEAFIGNVNAPMVIAYWSDYQCPFCRQNEENSMPDLIKDYVQTGKAKVIFKDFAFLGADSDRLAIAAHAVWEAAPDKFYAWHKAIFDNQGQENSGWATDQKINDITSGALGSVLAKKVAGLEVSNAAVYKAAIDADKAEGNTFGVSGTPAFVIGKGKSSKLIVGAQPYTMIKSAIDSL